MIVLVTSKMELNQKSAFLLRRMTDHLVKKHELSVDDAINAVNTLIASQVKPMELLNSKSLKIMINFTQKARKGARLSNF